MVLVKKCNKIGHKAIECRNRINQNSNFFSGRCYACNKYGHKANQCRNPVLN